MWVAGNSGPGGQEDHHEGVCHNLTNHQNYESNEADCEAAGHMWIEALKVDHEGEGGCHNTTTHQNYESNEADCEAAGHMWTEGNRNRRLTLVKEKKHSTLIHTAGWTSFIQRANRRCTRCSIVASQARLLSQRTPRPWNSWIPYIQTSTPHSVRRAPVRGPQLLPITMPMHTWQRDTVWNLPSPRPGSRRRAIGCRHSRGNRKNRGRGHHSILRRRVHLSECSCRNSGTDKWT